MITKILISIIAYCVCGQTFTQQFSSNIITDYFRDKFIYGIASTDNAIWFSGDGLIEYDGKNFISYGLSSNSTGNIDAYLNKKEYSVFDLISAKGNTLCLYDARNNVILKVENKYIYNYRNKKYLYKYIHDLSIDNNNSIWYWYYDDNFYYHIYCNKDNNFEEFKIPDEYSSMKLQLFIANDMYKYLIFMDKQYGNENSIYLLVIDGNDHLEEIKLNLSLSEITSFKSYSDSDFVYIMSNNYNIYFVKGNEIVREETLPKLIESKGGECFDFLVIGRNIYYTNICNEGIVYLDLSDSNSYRESFYKYDYYTRNLVVIPYYEKSGGQCFLFMNKYEDFILGTRGKCYSGLGINAYKYK